MNKSCVLTPKQIQNGLLWKKEFGTVEVLVIKTKTKSTMDCCTSPAATERLQPLQHRTTPFHFVGCPNIKTKNNAAPKREKGLFLLLLLQPKKRSLLQNQDLTVVTKNLDLLQIIAATKRTVPQSQKLAAPRYIHENSVNRPARPHTRVTTLWKFGSSRVTEKGVCNSDLQE